jgi:hypothetical protein
VKNKVIFETADDAIKHSKFYRERQECVEKYKYKDWAFVSANYDGVAFERWNISDAMMQYVWYQSLDLPSICLWNSRCILDHKLLHKKNRNGLWQ